MRPSSPHPLRFSAGPDPQGGGFLRAQMGPPFSRVKLVRLAETRPILPALTNHHTLWFLGCRQIRRKDHM
jgi:hypothetical protein